MKKELEIKDVMVGDWVDVRNDAAPNTPHLERITPSHFLRDEHLYGVELVPEILEKNEFLAANGVCVLIDEYTNDEIIILHKIANGFIMLTERMTIGLQNVHELQHLFRLCGITKNIIL